MSAPPLSPRSARADVALAVGLFVGAIVSVGLTSVAGMYGEEQSPLAMAIGYAFALAVPLAVRRRWPGTVAIVVSVAYFLATTLRVPELYAGQIAVFIAFYTVGAWDQNRRRAKIVRIAIIVGMFLWLFIRMFYDATQPADDAGMSSFSRAGAFSPYVAYTLLLILFNALYFGGAYLFGERAYAQMQQRRALEERSAELERERERTSAQAVALDRVRIARELHDVVAHHVSLMGVQTGAARATMAKDPEQARAILESVEGSARDTLRELRQLLETLRTPHADADIAPTTHGLGALAGLADNATAAGLPTTFAVVGEPTRVPDLAQLNLYRIMQEALTNARRHAGPHATADVRLRYTADSIELEVSNTGRVGTGGPGLGQLGMRERAGASGGSIEIGPRPRGGYRVRVSMPLTAKARARV